MIKGPAKIELRVYELADAKVPINLLEGEELLGVEQVLDGGYWTPAVRVWIAVKA